MTTERKFAGFQNKGAPPFRMSEVPKDGFCLSSFVLLVNSQGRVLMGKLNPDYAWDHIGAIDEERKRRHSAGWMLPSSHLMLNESPQAAAGRIISEQLGLEGIELGPPAVYSETYSSDRFALAGHWDLEFVFTGRHEEKVSHNAWRELDYVDPNAPEGQFARNHQDILKNAGLRRQMERTFSGAQSDAGEVR